MTDLQKKTPRLMEDEYMSLADEVIYWLTKPKILEDPAARGLAHRSWDILEGMLLPGDAHHPSEVRETLQQLQERVAEAMQLQVNIDSRLPYSLLQSSLKTRGRRKPHGL